MPPPQLRIHLNIKKHKNQYEIEVQNIIPITSVRNRNKIFIFITKTKICWYGYVWSILSPSLWQIVTIILTQPKFFVNATKAIFILFPASEKINFSIVSSLNDLYRQYQSGIISIIFVCLLVFNATCNNI